MSTLALAHRGREASTGRSGATDEDLVAVTRDGDDAAFERLYGRYQQRVTAYVTRIVGSRDHAEEIVQEAFISALRRLRETHQPITFKAWIYGIARNAAIDHLRARARRGTEIGFEHIEGGAEPAAPAARTPESALESSQALSDLRGAFGGLSEAHHQILVLRELEGLSYDQIARRLGLSRSQVESTLFRARRRLEEEYAELASGERCHHVQRVLERKAATAIGVREQRRLDRHLAHCDQCRRHARRARLRAVTAA